MQLKDAAGKKHQGELSLSPGTHNINILHDEKGTKGTTTTIATQGPIYRFHGQFGTMPSAEKCLIFNKEDFNLIKSTIHHGAFGADYEELKDGKVLVWKIPADVNAIHDWVVDETPNAVGLYTLSDDFNRGGGIPGNGTKYRIDTRTAAPGGVESVHHFVSENGNQIFAGFSTGNMYANFWSPTAEETKKTTDMLSSLKEAGVDAFSCNGAHHAIIFRMTPKELVQKLQDPVSGPAIKNALKEGSKDSFDVESWANTFIKIYGGENSPV